MGDNDQNNIMARFYGSIDTIAILASSKSRMNSMNYLCRKELT